ncbi:hypothetical protein AB3S75_031413 [Citrus x aurantiifolia]
MKILSWNVRDLENTRARLEVKNILQMHKPQILFFCETKLLAVQAREECRMLSIENCFVVNRMGLKGELALCWNTEALVTITSYSNHHIDVVAQLENGKQWRYTGIYRHPEMQQKQQTWTLLRRLSGLSNLSWLCFGDFNKILSPNEKCGGKDRNLSMMASFKEAAQACNLVDLGCTGFYLV